MYRSEDQEWNFVEWYYINKKGIDEIGLESKESNK